MINYTEVCMCVCSEFFVDTRRNSVGWYICFIFSSFACARSLARAHVINSNCKLSNQFCVNWLSQLNLQRSLILHYSNSTPSGDFTVQSPYLKSRSRLRQLEIHSKQMNSWPRSLRVVSMDGQTHAIKYPLTLSPTPFSLSLYLSLSLCFRGHHIYTYTCFSNICV